jgi:hypothetical protein
MRNGIVGRMVAIEGLKRTQRHPSGTQGFRRVPCETTHVGTYHWDLKNGVEVEHV